MTQRTVNVSMVIATDLTPEDVQLRVLAAISDRFEIRHTSVIDIVVLAQLNREVEKRGGDRRPALSDLKDSGAIEADADAVILLHREDAYDPESPRAGEIDLILAKSRHGPQTTVTCAYQGHYCRIADMARHIPPEYRPPIERGHLVAL
ncbi:hypothetical protein amrb99_98030 [Actinomadura sp. RB99]|nr:hypothetical protein [Actinomadura sp. RB99]